MCGPVCHVTLFVLALAMLAAAFFLVPGMLQELL